MTWPKPTNEAQLKKWQAGVIFDLKDGPADGMLVRLWPGPYPDTETSGWDELPFANGVLYRRPDGVDPYMERKGKPNKKRDNIPHMVFVGE